LGKVTLITGGARSGKSQIAERLVGDGGGRVCYVATAEPLDDEMRERIRRHVERRPSEWETVESPRGLPETLARVGREHDRVIVDCLTIYISNCLGDGAAPDDEIIEEAELIAETARDVPAEIVVITNEVGGGVVPANALARRFRDLQGLANQIVAKSADRVVLAVSGLGVVIKGEPID